jgi:hypothetical protein
MRHQAIYEVYPECTGIVDGVGAYGPNDELIEVDELLIQTKIAELQSAEPMRQLRQKRNQLLQQTDWRMTTDYPYSDQTAWASYRTQLRDLPMTSEPTLSESGKLIVDWPTAPDQT